MKVNMNRWISTRQSPVVKEEDVIIKHAQGSLVHFTLPTGGAKEKYPHENTDPGGSSAAVGLYA